MTTTLSLLSGKHLARSVAWNLAGAGIPLMLAFWAIPRLVDGMGDERFGLLGIIWAGIGYLNLFDFGIGAALAKLTAEHLGKGQIEDLPRLLATGLRLLVGLGVFAALIVLFAVTWIVVYVLKVPAALVDEALGSFWILSATLPFVTLMSGLTGILRAHQRFEQLNLIRIPLGVANFLFPVLALQATPSLVVTTSLLAVSRIIACFACGLLCRPLLSSGQSPKAFIREEVRMLLGFGGWLTVSNIIGPLMVYFDRFLIGAMVGMAAVAYYTIPYEVITRLWIVPDALFGVVFTALATALAADLERARFIFNASARGLFLFVGIPVTFAVLFAREGLAFWLGPVFAMESSAVLRWLAIGVFLNCVARLPLSALQAAGRPDLTAKLHLVELPTYLILLWFLTATYGIVGTAAAWTIRIAGDTVALFAISRQALPELRAEQARAFTMVLFIGFVLLCLCTLNLLALKIGSAFAVILFGTVLFVREWREQCN